MYNSHYTVKTISNLLKNEVDIQSSIDETAIARWITSLEQLLYADVIKDYRTDAVDFDGTNFTLFEDVKFDHIVKLYDEDEELVKCSPIAAHQFKGEKAIYWCEGDNCYAKLLRSGVDKLTVIFKAMPEVKTADSSETVCVPNEWIEMVLSKVRGEAYKLAGDDAQAAKWLNDYNTQLEQFKVWVAERQKWFGE